MDFEKFFKELKTEVLDLIKLKFGEEGQNVKDDVTLFLNSSKAKLKRWTELLANGIISAEEYELLLKSQKDLVVMTALHKAGVSAIKLGHFKNSVIKLIFSKVTLLLGL